MSATGEGGKFYKMMEKQSETWHGLTSTLSGAMKSIGRAFGDIIMQGLKPLLKMLIKVTQGIVAFAKTERGMAILKAVLIGLVPVIGTLLVGAFYALATAAWAAMAPLIPFLAIALAIGAALTILFLIAEDIYTYSQGGDSYFGDLMEYLGIAREDFIKFGKDVVEVFNAVVGGIKAAISALDTVISKIGDFLIKFKPIREWLSGTKEIGLNPNISKERIAEVERYQEERRARRAQEGTTGRATGGYVQSGNTYTIGEKGEELFSPNRSGYITPAGSFGGVTVNTLVGSINISVSNIQEGVEEIKMKVLDALNDLASNVFPTAAGIM
jgi:hypothetical protein